MGYGKNPDIWTDTVPEFLGGFINNEPKVIPEDHPETDIEFDFVSEEDKPAVDEMEATLDTDEPIYAPQIEEGTYMSDYVGTYELSGEGGEHVLLSPQRVDSENAIALHYANDEWTAVENVVVEDGYVYGDIESFSPVAVFAVKRDIVLGKAPYGSGKGLVCNGNRTVIFKDDEDNKVYALNEVSGTKVELPSAVMIVGGTIDGTPLEKTDLVFKNVELPGAAIIAGSFSLDERTTLESGNITLFNSKVRSITGSTLKVRTEVMNITLNDSTVTSFIGSGESQNAAVKQCVNAEVHEHLDMTAPYATKTANLTINNSTCPFFYVGGNCGYTYTENANLVVNGLKGTTNWMLACSSNGSCKNVTAKIDGAENVDVFGCTNRGYIGTVKSSIKNSKIKSLCVTGEMADDVNGTVDSVSLDIDSTVEGKLDVGRNGGHTLTKDEAAKIVNYVKYSRASKIEISDEVKAILGNKLIVK